MNRFRNIEVLKALQDEHQLRTALQQELYQKQTEMDQLTQKCNQQEARIKQLQAQMQWPHSVPDGQMRESIEILRDHIRNFAVIYFDGASQYDGHQMIHYFWGLYMTRTTLGTHRCMEYLRSTSRSNIIQAFLWRVLTSELFGQFRWLGTKSKFMKDLCYILAPLKPGEREPRAGRRPSHEAERKFHVWRAKTVDILHSSSVIGPESEAHRELQSWINGLVENIRSSVEPFLIPLEADQDPFIELRKVVEHALELDRIISRQVYKLDWIFEGTNKNMEFEPSIMGLQGGEMLSEQRPAVCVIVAPGALKQGTNAAEGFDKEQLLLPMKVSCKKP